MEDYQLKDYINAASRSFVNPNSFLKPREGSLDPFNLIGCIKYKLEEYIKEPDFFKPCGTKIFCGSQGEGKTLTAAAVYCHQLLKFYPKCILVSNTHFKDRPFNAYIDYQNIPEKQLKEDYELVKERRLNDYLERLTESLAEDFYLIKYPITTVEEYIQLGILAEPFDENEDFDDYKLERTHVLRDIFTNEEITEDTIRSGKHTNVTVRYSGLNTLKYIKNGKLGVIYFIDEIQLEFSSLDRNLPIEAVVEISQQRKQRKHVVGTAQRYRLMNIRLREQVHDIIGCHCFFGCIQWNALIDGETAHEDSNGELQYEIKKHNLFFHSPEMYRYYDTYAKMKRYNNEWKGRPNLLLLESDEIAELIRSYSGAS